ncbi:general secretion pathway protein GspN [Lysobacter sp. S4-A87]|uniref:general secretion pathway protein GspN n=1 Tax=Lysobacter sp. S4-A87 TaxID=2925843 RepID=UPI001F5335C1|nr:general secretion pathway protein GspN [Lysobacter sp. S4-A87]UNK48929.1 general secretion pathway protein GspN [Lysobacter sp. S4-A87]
MRLDDAGPRTWLLATVAGWALLAWLLAVAGMGRHAPALEADPSQLRPLPSTRAQAAERLGPLAQYAPIGARPLFSQDRQPKPFFLQGQGEGDSKSNAFDYLLTSVLITPTLHMAILQPADGSESVRVKLGEVPESHPSWRLTALDARSAVFEGPEGRREMTLRVFDGQGGQPPTPLNTVPGGGLPAGISVQAAPQATSPKAAANPARAPTAPGRAVSAAPNTAAAAANARPTEENDDAPATPEAQMEAIRKRIEARRAQMRQQQAAQPPAQTP